MKFSCRTFSFYYRIESAGNHDKVKIWKIYSVHRRPSVCKVRMTLPDSLWLGSQKWIPISEKILLYKLSARTGKTACNKAVSVEQGCTVHSFFITGKTYLIFFNDPRRVFSLRKQYMIITFLTLMQWCHPKQNEIVNVPWK